MKIGTKTALIFIGLVAGSQSVLAQSIDAISLKVGPIATSASTSLQADLDRRMAGAIYISAQKSLTPSLSAVLEAGLIQRGFTEEAEARDSFGNLIGTVSTSTGLYYVSVPLMSLVESDISSYRIYGMLGPRIDILVGNQTTDNELVRPVSEISIANSLASMAIGWTVAVGVSKPITEKAALLLELRYERDLSDSSESDRFEIRNNSVSALMGIQF